VLVHSSPWCAAAAEAITANPYNTMVRLVNPAIEEISSGYLEVFVNDVFGSVCNVGMNSASAACRQLGYTIALGVDERINAT